MSEQWTPERARKTLTNRPSYVPLSNWTQEAPPWVVYAQEIEVELELALEHLESQRAELEAADRMHRYVDWHIRRQTQNSYSLLRKSLDEYAAARAGENAGCYDPWGLERSE